MHALLLALLALVLSAPLAAQEVETERLVGIPDEFQDFFGRTVATYGPWLFVGATLEESGVATHWPNAGTIYVFYRSSQGWERTQTIRPSSYMAANFGYRMDASEGVLVVGNPWNRLIYGKAFVYELSNGYWSLAQELITSDLGPSSKLGSDVAIDGNRIVVGEFEDESLGFPWGGNGRVWVFEKGASGWTETAVLYPAQNQGVGLEPRVFGLAVALSGDRLAIASRGQTFHVQTFELSNGTWQHKEWLSRPTTIVNPNGANFGEQLAMDGEWLAVGEPAKHSVWPVRHGKVSIYRASTVIPGNWDLHQVLEASNASTPSGPLGNGPGTDSFGFSLDMQGSQLAVGARYGLSGSDISHGQAYLFELDPATQLWEETRRLSSRTTESNAVPATNLGFGVAVSEFIVAAGARWDLGASYAVQSGAAYVYEQAQGDSSCPGAVNSSGIGAELEITGVALASVNGLTARASQVAAPGFGLLITSQASSGPSTPVGSQGNLCLGGSLVRLLHTLGQATPDGLWRAPLDLPQSGITIQPGNTWHFQLWYRDFNPGPVSNFTNVVSITWQ